VNGDKGSDAKDDNGNKECDAKDDDADDARRGTLMSIEPKVSALVTAQTQTVSVTKGSIHSTGERQLTRA
jgi:hypothetical protein